MLIDIWNFNPSTSFQLIKFPIEKRKVWSLASGFLVFWFVDAEKPPSVAFAFAAGMPVEIDLHGDVAGDGDLVPVLADIQLGTAVAAFSGLAPGAQNSVDL